MLKQRILTALIAAPLILWSVVVFSHQAIAIELGLILVLAAWEWARLSGMTGRISRIGYSLLMAGVLSLVGWLMHRDMTLLANFLYVAVAWWLCAIAVIIVADRTDRHNQQTLSAAGITLNLTLGIIVLVGAFVAITALHQSPDYGYVYILLLLAIIWIADSAAYFTGKALGKHKLAPHVSPGKTWEGVIGAIVAVLIAAYIMTVFLKFAYPENMYFMLIALVTMLISIVGDLLESLLKRRVGVKDSSRLLPGHGGILDRIDSLVAAAPVFMLGLLLAGVK